MTVPPVFVSKSRADLGEGLVLSANGTVAWLDIHANKIFVLRNDAEQCFPLNTKATVIFFVDENSLEFASEEGIFSLDLRSGKQHLLVNPPKQKKKCLRSNDGCKLDGGRYLLGFMHNSAPNLNSGQLFYFCGERWHVIDDDIAIPNTFLQISETAFLISDSLRAVVWMYEFCDNGPSTSKNCWMRFEEGAPDGGCIYGDSALISLWDAGSIARIDLNSRERLDYELPFPRPTNCAVSPDGRKLWVTSAREGLSLVQLNDSPLSGALVAFEVDL